MDTGRQKRVLIEMALIRLCRPEKLGGPGIKKDLPLSGRSFLDKLACFDGEIRT